MTDGDSGSGERTWLLEQRKLLNEHRVGQHEFFDKSLLALATGGIGVSLPLASYFTSMGDLLQPHSLGTAWFALCVSLLSNLTSYLTGARSAARDIEALDHELTTGESTESWANPSRNLTSVLNYVSLFTFMTGAAALLHFAYNNTISG